MDTVPKQEYRIRDLPTRSVTLFPTRAQVVREIKNVVLKPGANEITVIGLTPTTDEESIKVEGTGSAIITDITVELLPNRDIYQDIYPDSDDESDDKDEDDEDESDDDVVNQALEDANDKLTELTDKHKTTKELIASAETRLKILDAHGASLDKKEHKDVVIGASLASYRAERTKIYQDHLEGTLQERALLKEMTTVQKTINKLLRQQAKKEAKAEKAKAKVRRAKEKIRLKEILREAERQKEKARIRKERENFWPKVCYSVRITLDAASFTPASSRRSSVASAHDVVKVATGKEDDFGSGTTCDLSLSYVTSSAFWSPSYDLALSTTTNTATLCFDAQLTNMTSETWSNCKVILSTSQTTFSGLQDDIPTLVPWRVKLAGRGGGALSGDIIDSREERLEKGNWKAAQTVNQAQKPRAILFGVAGGNTNNAAADQLEAYKQLVLAQGAPQQQRLAQVQMPQMQMQQMAPSAPPPPPGGVAYSNLDFYSNIAPAPAPVSLSLERKKSRAGPSLAFARPSAKLAESSASRSFGGGGGGGIPEMEEAAYSRRESSEYERDEDHDGATILEPTPSLSFQESSFEETGLTATYDLPSLKTLKPSSTASKQRVARIAFTNVIFSHTVIAKYKPVAYLKSKLRNTSPLTLLKGPTGLTLDGTFMGRTVLPRCSAGDSFTLSLGIDPAIKVAYPKPEIKRSTTGVFTKGDNSAFTRTITLVNSRAAGTTGPKFVNITVLDQVPVSEDEKLRIDVSFPRGLSVGGQGVLTGIPGKEGAATPAGNEKDWGKAVAVLKKAGEVSWDVQLAAGRSVKLLLQYEVLCPSGERIAQV